jgi:hypothetical protein
VAGLCAASLGATAVGAAAPDAELDGPTLCPFRLVTGLPCPFCGLTRSLVAFGQGRVEVSFERAPLGPLVPFLALAVGVAAVAAMARGRALAWPHRVLIAGAAAVAASWALQLARVAG